MTPTQQQVFLVLTEKTPIEPWITLALSLAGEAGLIHVRVLITVPAGLSPSEFASQAQAWRATLDPFVKQHGIVEDDFRVYVEAQPFQRLLQEAQEAQAHLLIVQWAGLHHLTGGATTDDILEKAPCDVALLYGEGWHQQNTTLLSLRGGRNLTLGIRIASALSGDSGITLFHADGPDHALPDVEVVMRAEPKITRAVTARTRIATGIVREAAQHGTVVLGAGLHKPPTGGKQPSVIEMVFDQLTQAVALVRARAPESIAFHAPNLIRAEADDLSTKVDRWFAENTFHSSEFEDIENLLALKAKRGVTISLGLPALNEQETIVNVIRTLKSALMDDAPLIDEIVLIDSDSTDDTVALALECGIPVYKHSEILPEVGTVRGKGEALWKSLHVLKGDIIAWVDTDITNIHPRFVYGLLGPLLKSPRLQFVKGFYQRPIQVGEHLHAFGGGRVTELVARPMFNIFYPELSGLIQPLSGEYAGRREALQRVPFFSGYGVETGLLIDLFMRYGLEALAQVDLEVRVHHNQPLVGLSKMAFAILQVFMARIEGRVGVQLMELANNSMKLVVHEPDRFALEIQQFVDIERPPMATLAAPPG